MEESKDPTGPQQAGEDSGGDEGENRRDFIKKLAYMAPVMETFMLSETAYGDDDDDDTGGGRGRGRTSPHPGRGRGRMPPPPPPPDDGGGDDDDDDDG